MRDILTLLVTITLVVCQGQAVAQQNLWREEGVLSPEVCEDGGVIFRLYAPNARRVVVEGDFASEPQPMSRNEQGVWEFRSEPLASDYYTYTFAHCDSLVEAPRQSHPLQQPSEH